MNVIPYPSTRKIKSGFLGSFETKESKQERRDYKKFIEGFDYAIEQIREGNLVIKNLKAKD